MSGSMGSTICPDQIPKRFLIFKFILACGFFTHSCCECNTRKTAWLQKKGAKVTFCPLLQDDGETSPRLDHISFGSRNPSN